ncbi:hypothetical protein E0493_22790 [Roseomonas sp. M0104]|uniref:Uncharacterized protein n=1 Tax=Teichococcus coralli TaxID=2545983 RepID=A0A845BGX4_9PROT|nr:hypothetical protein [Pseudoroseomonas coralli]MXP66158.1 hypothetical protein [Pseudoroseomonas coralli]
MRAAKRLAARAAPLLCVPLLISCGPPDPLNPAAELSRRVRTLGIHPFYPFRELPRIGAIYLVDRSAPEAEFAATDESRMLLTEELVGPFGEAFQARRAAQADGRFPQSPDSLVAALQPASGASFYRQPGAAAPGSNPRPVLDGNLPISGFPGFSLGSVDQSLLSVNVPTQFATFLAGLGLRSSNFVRMEAEGVEYADLPFDTVLRTIRTACSAPDSILGEGGWSLDARRLIRMGVYKLETDRRQRAGHETTLPDPIIGILTRVYYLRGIRFVVEESRSSSVIAQAARASRLPAGVTAPSVPSINIANTVAPAAAGARAPSPDPALAAQLDQLNQAVESLRSAISSSTGAGAALSTARATARGLEQVTVFDRPLAFGYDAYWTGTLAVTRDATGAITATPGLSGLCALGE